MAQLEKREKRLQSKLDKIEVMRKKLRRDLQLVRMKMAGLRRRVQGKAQKAVAALLARTNPDLYKKLVSQTGAAPKPRKRRRKAKAVA